MPRINLLPWREAERKRKRQEFGAASPARWWLRRSSLSACELQMQSRLMSSMLVIST